jgi:hypothetical protein
VDFATGASFVLVYTRGLRFWSFFWLSIYTLTSLLELFFSIYTWTSLLELFFSIYTWTSLLELRLSYCIFVDLATPNNLFYKTVRV